jgi:hypothetical protein
MSMVFGVGKLRKNGTKPATGSSPQSESATSIVNSQRVANDAQYIVRAAWLDYGDVRQITAVDEVSAHVSTNRVFRASLDDGSHIVCKVSSYGSYFLFVEDHDRLFRCQQLLANTRWATFLATILSKNGRVYTWYDESCWAVFYVDVERGEQLPKIVTDDDVRNLASEIAQFHSACALIAPQLSSTSNSIKGDAIHFLDQLMQPNATNVFGLSQSDVATVRKSTHQFLVELESITFDEWQKIPILLDWNLGNFSIQRNGDDGFQLMSRWDYDWFRIDTRLLDFYFFSRVSSKTGDKTSFTYSPHTLLEPKFITFLKAYHSVNPLSEAELRFLPFAYRFFILNYVIREGSKFFRSDLSAQFKQEAARIYLPQLDHFDITPILAVLD